MCRWGANLYNPKTYLFYRLPPPSVPPLSQLDGFASFFATDEWQNMHRTISLASLAALATSSGAHARSFSLKYRIYSSLVDADATYSKSWSWSSFFINAIFMESAWIRSFIRYSLFIYFFILLPGWRYFGWFAVGSLASHLVYGEADLTIWIGNRSFFFHANKCVSVLVDEMCRAIQTGRGGAIGKVRHSQSSFLTNYRRPGCWFIYVCVIVGCLI